MDEQKKKFRLYLRCFILLVAVPLFFCFFRPHEDGFVYGRDTEAYFGNLSVEIWRAPDTSDKRSAKSVYMADFLNNFEIDKAIEQKIFAYYFDRFSGKLYIRGESGFTVVSAGENCEKHLSPDDFPLADMIVFKTAWFEYPNGIPNSVISAFLYLWLSGIALVTDYLNF